MREKRSGKKDNFLEWEGNYDREFKRETTKKENSKRDFREKIQGKRREIRNCIGKVSLKKGLVNFMGWKGRK